MTPTPSPLALAQALIRCRSVTPADDGALDVAADALRAAGFAVHRPVFSEPGYPDTPNLYARLGTSAPCLLLAGHTDVVPPGEEAAWTHPPFDAVVADGILYGRGACDMKGGVAAALAAAIGWAGERDPTAPGSVAVLLTGDEEGPAVNGSVKLLAWAHERGERWDACILGEPTCPEHLGDTAKIGRRGSLTGRVTVRGRQGHVAYPHLARNPIPVLARIVAALADEPLDGGTESFDPSGLEWTSVDVGNPATNVVPGEARGTFNVRFNDRWTPDTLAAELRRRLETVPEPDGVEVEVAFLPTNSVAFLTPAGAFVDRVRAAIRAETGRDPALSTTGGTSDARFIRSYCPAVEFGPVGQTMHMANECVRVADLDRLAAVYRRLIEATLAGDA